MNYIFLAVIFVISICHSWGQILKTDSNTSYTDTIVIYKDPLVIRKKIYLAPPAILERQWYAELAVGGGWFKNNYSDQNSNGISEKLNQVIVPTYTANIGLFIFRKFTKWDIGLGIQIENYKEKFAFDAVKTNVEATPYLRTDTIDIYYNVINTDTTYFYVEETTLQNKYDTQTTSEKLNANNTSTFLAIPFQIKYKIFDKKIGLQILVGIVPAMVVTANGNSIVHTAAGHKVVNLTKRSFSTLSLSGNVGFALSYPIFTHTKINLQPLYSTHLSNIAASIQPYILKRSRFTVQVGIQVEF